MLMQQKRYPLRNLLSPVALIFWVLLGYGTFRMQASLEKVDHWRKQLLSYGLTLLCGPSSLLLG